MDRSSRLESNLQEMETHMWLKTRRLTPHLACERVAVAMTATTVSSACAREDLKDSRRQMTSEKGVPFAIKRKSYYINVEYREVAVV